jgi:signal transduction histidine kinase/ActR/RegA family two-component response regulator
MSLIDPQVIHSEQHAEVGNLLLANVDIILDRWSRRAKQEQPNSVRVHHDVLLDHFIELLQTIGRTLAASDEAHTIQHCLSAAKHGEQRWDAGWSLADVVRDYQILRLVILEFLEESLDRALRFREVLAIGLVLDESISASVVVYIRGREEYLKTLEEKRLRELEEVQKQLKAHAQSLQQADRRKNEFLAMLAHELRNPLAPVRNAARILRLKDSSDPELRSAQEIIERQAQHMSRMIDDLFDISRIAHGKVSITPKPIPLSFVVERAIEDVRPLVEAGKRQLIVAPHPQPIWVTADMDRLVQVLVNLLVNAVKYTDEGGQVRVTTEVDRGDAVVKVRDTGIGIPSDLLPHIFEPFMQEQQSEDRVHGGLGIGLALVRSLVDLHGGRVSAWSAGRGQGSEFVVRLPLLKDFSPPATVPTVEQSPVVSRRVLVVDDNRDAAHSLAILLKLIGHDVKTAHDGMTALEVARTQLPEIILLDIGMPRMDGLEVARRLRQEHDLTDVLLVALTGYGHEQDRRRTMAAGFNVHLVKPIELVHLSAILQKPSSRRENS